MSCEELREHYELYVLGAAEEAEQDEIRAHLQRECQSCMAGVKEARRLAALLSVTPDAAAPSPRLRKRLLASVGPGRRQWSWALAWAAAAVCLVVAVSAGLREQRARGELGRLQAELSSRTSELARLNEAFAILNTPDATEVSFGQKQPQPPRGKVFVSPARGVLLLASNLSPAPSGKIYEMWVIPKGGQPAPAGLFQSEATGSALHIRRGAIDTSAVAAIAVTLENEGGAAQPTSQPLIVAALTQPGVAR